MSRPLIKTVGFFSVTSDREFHNDMREKKHLQPPYHEETNHCQIDISATKEQVDEKNSNQYDYDKEYNSHLLQWIRENNYSTKGVDFLCNRQLLRRIMEAGVTNQETHIEVCAVKEKGVIHMHILPRKELYVFTPASVSGFLFERKLFSKENDDDAEERESLTRRDAGFMCVYRAELSEFTLLYKAEVDGFDYSSTGEPVGLVETKTSYDFNKVHGGFKFDKLFTWWASLCFGKINKIICGFREDKEGKQTVTSLKHYTFDDLEKALGYQTISRCFTKLELFLRTVKNEMNACPERQPTCFEWPTGRLEVAKSQECCCLESITS